MSDATPVRAEPTGFGAGPVPRRSAGPAAGHDYPSDDQFDVFVRTRTTALLRSAYLLTGDHHLAEDLVQTALARTHRAWRRLHRHGNAEAYTRRTMYHLQVPWWRRRRVAEVLPGELPERRDRASEDTATVALRLVLLDALSRLTARQRAVLVLRFFEDLSEVQTAELLGVNVGTVKSQTSKALARLRTHAPELGELDHGNGGDR
jgi:RNA polymerase sigma-70 factor (sigma-E family)